MTADSRGAGAVCVLWPGSDAALAAGCSCPVLDNGHGSVEAARDRGGWWMFSDCVVHGPEPAPIPPRGPVVLLSAWTPVLLADWTLLLIVLVVVAVLRARSAVRQELVDLPVPADAPRSRYPGRAAAVPSSRSRGRGRGGQRVDRAGVQERAARDALRCQGGRVDVAPLQCPLDRSAQ